MIRHKHFRGWKIDGNREYTGGLIDEMSMITRRNAVETLEEEHIRIDPEAWDVIDHENDDTIPAR